MADLLITILDEDADALARRLVSDINGSVSAAEAELARRPARAGEKGVIETVGSLVVALLGTSGIESLVGILRDLVTRGGPMGSHQRQIELTFPDGKMLKLHGRMSDDQFAAVIDAILALMKGDGGR
jgi:hypothetical protein